ncbi:MAG: TldD-like protein [Thermofilum sp. ex4484_82]|nr:MAG: TldD-like protein [Thermofilum sp. ex4484_82]OYT35688.1 MAG: TldD-like protein [Archaeoglobales archaeon ex4484_92]
MRCLGFASANRLDKESIKKIVKIAFKTAKASSALFKKKIEFAGIVDSKASWTVSVKEDPFDVGVDDKINLLTEIEKELLKTGIMLSNRLFEISFVESRSVFANSEGALIKAEKTLAYMFYNIVAFVPGKGVANRWREFGATGGWEAMKEWRPVEKIIEEAHILNKVLEEGKKPPNEPVDLILGSEVTGIIVHESKMIGETIGSEVVTIVDDPTIPKSFGFYLYDDEGVKARPRELYKNGKINEFLHNRETASVFGIESNASARAVNYAYEPIIRMANTYFKPGDYEFEELIEDVKKGVYIKTFMEWNIDDRRWNQRYVGLESYLIENGEIKGFIRNPVLEVTTKGLYSKIDAADKNLAFVAGQCGKGEPAQAIPVWMGGPNVRVRNIKVGVV